MAPKPKRGLDKRQKVWITAVVGIAAILVLVISLSPSIKKTLLGEASWGKVKADVGKIQGTKIKGSFDTKKITLPASASLVGCTGSTPGYATLCSGDDDTTKFGGALPKVVATSCTSATWCEYTCNIVDGIQYVPDFTLNTCVHPYLCTNIPTNAQLCVGDNQGLTTDTTSSLVDSCGPGKCEFTCNSGYGRGNSGTSCVPCVSRPAGLVGWWRGENNILSSVGTIHGNFFDGTYDKGKVGEAFSFGREEDEVLRIPDSTALDISRELTVELWIKLNPEQLYSFSTILEKGDANAYNGYSLSYNYGGYKNDDGTWAYHPEETAIYFTINGYGPGADISLDRWNHFVAVYRGVQNKPAETYSKIYVNGVLKVAWFGNQEFMLGGYLPQAISLNNEPLRIGQRVPGLIDEISIYNRALTENEIQSLYNAGGAGKCLTS